ncbi:MAG: hypothetical protein NZ551_04215 [Microscillaceae bacterium]|nr:hypothetical protein [Microscillaceae bacterium]MDW8460396.1 hypothetical protein [Cytophagales bacterium]
MNKNIIIGGLAVLLAVAAFLIYGLNASKKTVDKTAKSRLERIKRMEQDSIAFVKQLDSLNEQAAKLEKEAESLVKQRNRLQASRDSLQRLLGVVMAREKNANAKIAQLQKQIKDLQTQLDAANKRYEEVVSSGDNSLAELRREIERVKQERDEALRKLGQAKNETKDIVASALSVFSVQAVPGELDRRGQFSPSRRARNTDRVQLTFKLSRAPQPNEEIVVKLTNPKGREVPLKPKYRSTIAPKTDQVIYIEPDGVEFESGTYNVQLFLLDVDRATERLLNKTTFDLR